MKGSVPISDSIRPAYRASGGATPRASRRRSTLFFALAAEPAHRGLCLGLLLCISTASLAAVNEGIRLRLSDQLSEDVRDDVVVSEELAARERGDLLPKFSGLTLGLTAATLHDDNVLRSTTNEVSSVVLKTAPKVNLEGRVGRHDFLLGYEGVYAHHVDISDEDYDDHDFIADADLRFSRRLKVVLDNGISFGHDRRGSFTSRLTGSTEPDRWRHHHAGITATFGRAWASVLPTKAGLGVGFEQSGIRYLNNNQGSRDFDRQSFALKGRYNLGPKLSAVADGEFSFTDYSDPATPLDNREISALFGIAWRATAKTRGEVKFGLIESDFDDPGQSDFSGANFDFDVEWLPRSFSAITAHGSREISDTGQGGGSVVVDTAGLRWRHGFSSRLAAEAGVEFQQADFQSNREDETFAFDISARYSLNRFVQLRGGLEYLTRDSTDPGADYDNTLVFIELNVSLERGPGARELGN